MNGDYISRCLGCGFVQSVKYPLACRLGVGDILTPSMELGVGTCLRCKLQKMEIISVPAPPSDVVENGFTRVPTS